jgi:serine/threonine protein kinase
MNEQFDSLNLSRTFRQDDQHVLAGRYEIVRKLGEGGMGTVWLARDRTLSGRQVAIKMLLSYLSNSKRAIKGLKREAANALRLSHPNIVTTRSFEETDEGALIVMDYVDGESLEDVLAERDTLPEDDILRVFGSLAIALDYAHEKGVIHRDISPPNILIARDGTPYLTDFGIAQEARETTIRTTGKQITGKLPYMSPEQLRGEDPTSAQDIYSLAATMYECLAGHPPFFRGDIAHQIEHVEPEPPESDSHLTEAILVGLSKEPTNRSLPAALLLAPAQHLRAEVVASPPQSQVVRGQLEDQSHPARAASAARIIRSASHTLPMRFQRAGYQASPSEPFTWQLAGRLVGVARSTHAGPNNCPASRPDDEWQGLNPPPEGAVSLEADGQATTRNGSLDG